jgi:hypothetical protein
VCQIAILRNERGELICFWFRHPAFDFNFLVLWSHFRVQEYRVRFLLNGKRRERSFSTKVSFYLFFHSVYFSFYLSLSSISVDCFLSLSIVVDLVTWSCSSFGICEEVSEPNSITVIISWRRETS